MPIYRFVRPTLFGVLTVSILASGMSPTFGVQDTPDPSKQQSKNGEQKGDTQSQNAQNIGPIVAAPGATVVAPSQGTANGSGLIVAAPGSMVVVQQIQPAAKSTTKAASKPNSFASNTDETIITKLGSIAKTSSNNNKIRVGAIDKLGSIGGGTDQPTINLIVKALADVLEPEISKGPNADQYICFHTVQAIGQLGWGGRTAIPDLISLRGINVILDGAIDQAIVAMQNSTPPKAPSDQKGNGSQDPGNNGTPDSNQ